MGIKESQDLAEESKPIGRDAMKCSRHLGLAVLFVSSLLLVGCDDVDAISGERLSVRSVLKTQASSEPAVALGPKTINLPKLSKSSNWTHRIAPRNIG